MNDVYARRNRLRKVKAVMVGGALALAVLAPAAPAGASQLAPAAKAATVTRTAHPTTVKPHVIQIAKMAGRKVG